MNWFQFQKGKTKTGKIKGIVKKSLLGITAALALAFTFAAPSVSTETQRAKATGTPRFNFLEGDKELIRGAKLGESSWVDPVSANLGDRVAVLVYFHNGMENTIAHNTRIKVNLNDTPANPVFMTASIDSDETVPVIDTIVNGAIVGKSGLTVNLPDVLKGRAEYVPGTTKIYRDGSTTGTPAADGITVGSGLNIGDVQGCWQFSGFVSFIVQIQGESDVKIEKRVAHPGDADWQTQITAKPGDEVVYRVGIQNDGGMIAKDAVLKDDLPADAALIPGTTYLFTKQNPEGIKLADTIESGLTLADIVPGFDGAIYITYRAKINPNLPTDLCGKVLVNTAKIIIGGLQKGFAQAKVLIDCPPPAEKKLEIEKLVRKDGAAFVTENTANINDILEYKITIKNSGNTLIEGIAVRDALPVFVNYIPGSTRVNGTTVSDQIITEAGLSVGSLQLSNEIVILLKGKIIGCPPGGDYKLQNTAMAKASGVAEIRDSAFTIVKVTGPIEPLRFN